VGGAADSTVLENWMEGKWVGPLMGHSWKKWVELLMGYSWKIGRKIKVHINRPIIVCRSSINTISHVNGHSYVSRAAPRKSV